jgi:Zn-dependent protease
MVVLLFAISAHEAAHAWMSNRFGDDTARLLGRITLNPMAHIDPIGTLLIPIVGFVLGSAGGGRLPLIGWGKPTPVNPLRWRQKDLANVMPSLQEPVALILERFLTMNISLAVFNLLPFPPLDGSKILETFLPDSAQPILALMEQYGYIILMVLIYVGFFSAIIRPIMTVVYYLLYLGVE